MGLFLRYNLFRDVTARDVFAQFKAFYAPRDFDVIIDGPDGGEIEIFEAHNGWVVVDLDRGWEWNVRRQAQRFISERLHCAGFLAFVYDGYYWGYEFFADGKVLDQFVQDMDEGADWFPGKSCVGNADVVCSHLPAVEREVFRAYLLQRPAPDEKARLNHEFCRFDECAILDFLRALGVPVALEGNRVVIRAESHQSFSLRRK